MRKTFWYQARLTGFKKGGPAEDILCFVNRKAFLQGERQGATSMN